MISRKSEDWMHKTKICSLEKFKTDLDVLSHLHIPGFFVKGFATTNQICSQKHRAGITEQVEPTPQKRATNFPARNYDARILQAIVSHPRSDQPIRGHDTD